MAEIILLESAQRELEVIGQIHMRLSGVASARKIADLILDSLSRLEQFPLSGHPIHNNELKAIGYRCVIAGKYICVYRLIGNTVYVYHIAHGASNYPTLLKNMDE